METRSFPIESCQFTIVEAAQHLKISRSSLYELIREKKLKTAKLCGRTIVPGREIKRIIDDVAAHAA